jgi:hypothetical protein
MVAGVFFWPTRYTKTMPLPTNPSMNSSRRLVNCAKFLFGAVIGGYLAFTCVEPFMTRRANFDGHHAGVAEWLLAALILPSILIMFVTSIGVTVICLVGAFRSLRGTTDIEGDDVSSL